MKPAIVLINGYPGSGKTTLMHKLAADLKLPAISKDQVKEFLYDTMHIEADIWSPGFGRVASNALVNLADEALALGQSILLEEAYVVRYAVPKLSVVFAKYQPNVVEVYCHAPIETLRERYGQRESNGAHHQVHASRNPYTHHTSDELAEKYGSLKLGELIKLDTTNFPDEDYQLLVQRIKIAMEDEHAKSS